jgi:hypothetical protein
LSVKASPKFAGKASPKSSNVSSATPREGSAHPSEDNSHDFSKAKKHDKATRAHDSAKSSVQEKPKKKPERGNVPPRIPTAEDTTLPLPPTNTTTDTYNDSDEQLVNRSKHGDKPAAGVGSGDGSNAESIDGGSHPGHGKSKKPKYTLAEKKAYHLAKKLALQGKTKGDEAATRGEEAPVALLPATAGPPILPIPTLTFGNVTDLTLPPSVPTHAHSTQEGLYLSDVSSGAMQSKKGKVAKKERDIRTTNKSMVVGGKMDSINGDNSSLVSKDDGSNSVVIEGLSNLNSFEGLKFESSGTVGVSKGGFGMYEKTFRKKDYREQSESYESADFTLESDHISAAVIDTIGLDAGADAGAGISVSPPPPSHTEKEKIMTTAISKAESAVDVSRGSEEVSDGVKGRENSGRGARGGRGRGRGRGRGGYNEHSGAGSAHKFPSHSSAPGVGSSTTTTASVNSTKTENKENHVADTISPEKALHYNSSSSYRGRGGRGRGGGDSRGGRGGRGARGGRGGRGGVHSSAYHSVSHAQTADNHFE